MMARYDFDLFTIGAGSGGVASSRRAASYGARVAIAEKNRVGGTCVLRGCVPKKLLVYGSEFADAFADARGFGWEESAPGFDWPSLIAAKDREIERLSQVYIRMLTEAGVSLLSGRARLLDAHTVAIEGRRWTADKILLATGSRPVFPEIPGIEHAISSNEALDLETLPGRIVIVGGGYIAVEFAGIFGSLGAEVVELVRREAPLFGFDGDIRAALSQEMRARGIAIHASTHVARIEKEEEGYRVLTGEGGEFPADCVLYATGRWPNTAGMGLAEAGVALGEKGAILVDKWSQTSIGNIYAVGDVTDRLNLTPVAIAEGRALAETLFNDNRVAIEHEGVPSAVFSQPPLAVVGWSEERARAELGDVDVYLSRFKPMKNTLSGRSERTLMKLVVDPKSDRVLGCHMLGRDAPEIIQGLAVALKCGARKRDFDETVGIHPSAAEEFVTMREKRARPPLAGQ